LEPNRQIIDNRYQPSGDKEHESHATSNGTVQNDSGWDHRSLWHQDLNDDENDEQDGKGDKKTNGLRCRPGVGGASLLKSEDEAYHGWNEEKNFDEVKIFEWVVAVSFSCLGDGMWRKRSIARIVKPPIGKLM
jgi:hypothetical protein